MTIYRIEWSRHDEGADTTEAASLAEAMEILRRVRPGVTVEAVNGTMAVGACESCGLPLLDGDRYLMDSEGVRWHRACPVEHKP